MSLFHTGMGSQMGPTVLAATRGPQEGSGRGGMYPPELEEELPVLTFTRFTGAIEFVSEM